MLVQMLQLQGKKKKSFHNFCAMRGSKTGLQNTPIFFGIAPAPHRGLGGLWTPAIQAQYSPSTVFTSHFCVWSSVSQDTEVRNRKVLSDVWTSRSQDIMVRNRKVVSAVWTVVSQDTKVRNRKVLSALWTVVSQDTKVRNRKVPVSYTHLTLPTTAEV